jgi:Arc/MetJ-type ribon-helix-helix transcriptional regulator
MDDQLNIRVTSGLREDLSALVGDSEWFDTEAEAVRYAIRQLVQDGEVGGER